MSVADQARAAALAIECKKDSLQQKQDGTWKLVLTIAPDGLPDEIMRALPGTRYQTAFVEVGDDEEPVQRKPFESLSRAQQAGILCSDEGFQHWFYNTYDMPTESGVRSVCGVESRTDLDKSEYSRDQWDKMVFMYRAHQGEDRN